MTLGCSLSLSGLNLPPMCKEAIDMASLILSLQHPPWADLWTIWLPFVPQIDQTCSCLRAFALALSIAYKCMLAWLALFHPLNLSSNITLLARASLSHLKASPLVPQPYRFLLRILFSCLPGTCHDLKPSYLLMCHLWCQPHLLAHESNKQECSLSCSLS